MILRFYAEYNQFDYSKLMESDFIGYREQLDNKSNIFMMSILQADLEVSLSQYKEAELSLTSASSLICNEENQKEYLISKLYYLINKGNICEAENLLIQEDNLFLDDDIQERKLLWLYLKSRILYSKGSFKEAYTNISLASKDAKELSNPYYFIYIGQLQVEILLVKGELNNAQSLFAEIGVKLTDLKLSPESMLNINQAYFEAMICRYSFQFDQILILLGNLLKRVQQVYGEKSSFVAMVYYEMAAAHSFLNQFEELKKYNDLSQKIRMELFDYPTIEMAENYYMDGLYYNYIANHLDSIRMIEKAMDQIKGIIGNTHPLYHVFGFSKILSYIEVGEDFLEMKKLLAEYLKSLQTIRGKKNPELIYYYLIYAEMAVAADEIEDAELYLNLASDITIKALGVKSLVYADCLKGYAGLDRVKEYFDKSESRYIDALNIIQENGKGGSLRYSNVLEFLGEMYIEADKTEKAIPIYEECLRIEKAILPQYHLNFVLHYTALCEIGINMNQKELISTYVYSLDEILNKLKNKENPYFSKAYQICSLAYEVLGNLDKALKLMELALLFLARLIKRNQYFGFSPLSLQIDYLRILAKRGEFEEAISFGEMLIQKEKEFPELLELTLRLADLYHVCEDYDKSTQLLLGILQNAEMLDYRKDLFYLLLAKNYLFQEADLECKKYLDLAFEERVHFFGLDNQETSDILQLMVDWAKRFGHEQEKIKYLNQLNNVRSKFLN